MPHPRPHWKTKNFPLLLLAILATLLPHSHAADPHPTWRVWLEPMSSHSPLTQPIDGAERTVLCAGILLPDGLQPLTKSAFQSLDVPWPLFISQARENADADLATLKPRYQRNRQHVIQYAELQSPQPIVASAVLSKQFLPLFQNTLGDKVLVVIPNRFTAFVFPALANNLNDFAPMILNALRSTAWPISLEVFEVSSTGFRSVGRSPEP
ncbi:MAG: hypothetical protein WCI46_11870 [Verrucomicrobiota bacterium]